MKHGGCADEQENSQHGLHRLLPALGNLRSLWTTLFGHERACTLTQKASRSAWLRKWGDWSSCLVQQGFSTVRKMMYKRVPEEPQDRILRDKIKDQLRN